MEISHPDKASQWFAPGAQAWTRVNRFGRFGDERLSDETIISEIVGDSGTSDTPPADHGETDSPPQIRSLVEAVENLFFYNSGWRGAVRDLINYAQRTGPATVELLAYSNEDILRGVAAAAFGYPGYLPTFRLDVIRDGATERFLGLPEWDGRAPDFDRIIAGHFSGDGFAYFMAAHFGENRTLNVNIMEELGLRYGLFRQGEDGPERVRVQGSAIIVEPRPIRGSVFTMISEHQDQVHTIVELFMTHDGGFQRVIEEFVNSDLPRAERALEAMVAEAPTPAQRLYWQDDLDGCDLCQHPFVPLRYMVDASLPGGGGANVCALCFLRLGSEKGPPHGQVYEATEEGWLKVAG